MVKDEGRHRGLNLGELKKNKIFSSSYETVKRPKDIYKSGITLYKIHYILNWQVNH